MAHVNEGHTVWPATHKLSEPYLPLLPYTEHHRTLPVLTSHPAEGRRLSWPGTAQEYVCVQCTRNTSPQAEFLFFTCNLK